jgi:VWFA-related protein
MNMFRSAALFCIAVIAAQAQQPLFRTGTRLVQVDVVVRNNKGPVKGLTKDDFTIEDKGKKRDIAFFNMTETTAAGPPATPLPNGVVSNRINSKGETSRTATIVLFDRLNTPDQGVQGTAGRQVLDLLKSLKAEDRVGFYSLYNNLAVVQEFMNSGDAIAQAADRVEGGKTDTSGLSPQDQALQAALSSALTPTQPLDKTARVAITTTAFRSIARRVSGVPGRKVLLWVTSTVPLTYGNDAARRSNDEEEIQRYANILGDANIALFMVDPRGSGSSFTANTNESNSQGGQFLGRGAASTVSQTASSLGGDQGMEMLSQETGGQAFINVNNITDALKEAIDSSEVTYTLGFYVDDKGLDGKKHDLNVKIAKKSDTSGAKVYARKSYLAVTEQALATQQEIPNMDALASDRLDATGIAVMAVAVPDPSKPGTEVVQVRVDPTNLEFEHVADSWVASFDLGLASESANGQAGSVSVKTMPLKLSDAQLKQAMAGGIDINNTVPSPSQPSMLRVVVQDKKSGKAGSVRIPIYPSPASK